MVPFKWHVNHVLAVFNALLNGSGDFTALAEAVPTPFSSPMTTMALKLNVRPPLRFGNTVDANQGSFNLIWCAIAAPGSTSFLG